MSDVLVPQRPSAKYSLASVAKHPSVLAFALPSKCSFPTCLPILKELVLPGTLLSGGSSFTETAEGHDTGESSVRPRVAGNPSMRPCTVTTGPSLLAGRRVGTRCTVRFAAQRLPARPKLLVRGFWHYSDTPLRGLTSQPSELELGQLVGRAVLPGSPGPP